jgi:tetratricopeptide (TPR) repeat protein
MNKFSAAVSLATEGRLAPARDLFLDLLIDDPNNTDVIYNLAMCYTDLDEPNKAIELLERCIAIAPRFANAHVALGFAYIKAGDTRKAKHYLEKALEIEPDNPHAHRNLGGIYGNEGNNRKSAEHLKKALEADPNNVRAVYGLAVAYFKLENDDSADPLLRQFLKMTAPSDLHEEARTMLRVIAERTLRARGMGAKIGFRSDVLFYCMAAIEKFNAMSRDEVQKIAFEIALKGRGGFDINNPDKKYKLNSMPGEFTGLQLVSYMYVGFQMIAPDQDVGIDLSAEYKQAKALFDKGERSVADQAQDLLKNEQSAAPASQSFKPGELDLSEPVRTILEQVRELTGKGFRFIEKNDLPGHDASVKMARRSMPEHLIFYKAAHDDIVNHYIAHECGHILRLFRAAPEKRKMVGTNQATRAKAMSEIASEIDRIRSLLKGQDLGEVTSMWYQGIVRQVDNQPADTMIEKWLYEGYPDLRPQQAVSLKKQMRMSLQALTEDVRRLSPAKIYDANCTMNYTYFKLLGEFTDLPLHGGFKSSRYRARGEELYKLTRDTREDSYEGDLAMTDRWAEFLGLTGWFYRADFEAIPEDYTRSF